MYEQQRTAFPKDLVGVGKREKVDKDDRTVALYKERLNRPTALLLQKEMIEEVYRS